MSFRRCVSIFPVHSVRHARFITTPIFYPPPPGGHFAFLSFLEAY